MICNAEPTSWKWLEQTARDGESIKAIPDNLKQGKFETVASFHSHTEIGEYEKGSIFPAILRVLEVIKG